MTATPARPYTDQTVLDYLAAGATPADAARHFGIDPRSVRRIRQRAEQHTRAEIPPARDRTAQDAPIAPIAPMRRARVYAAVDVPAMNATVQADAVARPGVMWRCPHCGELQHPLPGTTGAAWAARGCYLCATPRPIERVDHNANQAADSDSEDWTGGPDSDTPPIVLESAESSGQESGPVIEDTGAPSPVRLSGPEWDAPLIVRERVIVRVPEQRPSAGVAVWTRARDVFAPGPVLGLLLFVLILLIISL